MGSSMIVFWKKLKTVQTVSLRCTKEKDWHGFAKVFVSSEESRTILFHEKGEWENRNLSFSNTLRWRLHSDRISLEHLRFGSQFPVSLVDFTQEGGNWLVATNPHLCGSDRYSACISWDQEGIHLHWKVQGPLKNEEIYSYYQ